MSTAPAADDTAPSEPFGLYCDSITLRDGTPLDMPISGVTVVVGPNNSGKSTLLREIHMSLTNPGRVFPENLAVSSAQWKAMGSVEQFKEWIDSNYEIAKRSVVGEEVVKFHQAETLLYQALQSWENPNSPSTSVLSMIFLSRSDVSERIAMVAETGRRATTDTPPTHPLHYIEDERSLMSRLDRVASDIFGIRLTLDNTMANLRVRIGMPDTAAPRYDEETREYTRAVNKLPQLSYQGDGVRHFIGMLLPLLTSKCTVTIIDEPEAFLHPPQAFALGRLLGQIARERSMQVLLATHDKDLLAGLTFSDAPLTVIRTQRTHEEARVTLLDRAAIENLWQNPVLRYSNVLSGLFHQVAVLAEAEDDCRFYEAALDEYRRRNSAGEDAASNQHLDILFVPTHGKGAMPKIAKLMRQLAIPVVIAADLDLLMEKTKVTQAAEAASAVDAKSRIKEIEDLWRDCMVEYRKSRPPRTVSQVRQALEAELNKASATDEYGNDLKNRLSDLISDDATPSTMLKRTGISAFHGESYNAATSLIKILEDSNVVLATVGELESFAPSVATAKGPQWLTDALEAKAHTHQPAQDHIKRLLDVANRAASEAMPIE
ncbi:ATP-dependent endonuclease [Rhodococcus oryzae]|uniref:ATP-dependent nuclease n=1 Tax=Rhodococcus oryzae TaxID=2571143 RepID=UPI0037126D3A